MWNSSQRLLHSIQLCASPWQQHDGIWAVSKSQAKYILELNLFEHYCLIQEPTSFSCFCIENVGNFPKPIIIFVNTNNTSKVFLNKDLWSKIVSKGFWLRLFGEWVHRTEGAYMTKSFVWKYWLLIRSTDLHLKNFCCLVNRCKRHPSRGPMPNPVHIQFMPEPLQESIGWSLWNQQLKSPRECHKISLNLICNNNERWRTPWTFFKSSTARLTPWSEPVRDNSADLLWAINFA
jgi:hypothetical protein